MTEEAFAARLRQAMTDAGIESAAELERRWVDRFGGKPANVHRQVMRLLNQAQSVRPMTAERLAALTGQDPSYFSDGQPQRRQSRLAEIERRLRLVEDLVVNQRELALAVEAHERDFDDLLGTLEKRLEALESRLPPAQEQQ